MTVQDVVEVYLAFKQLAKAVEWPEDQWVAILIPCLVQSTQQAVDTIPAEDCCIGNTPTKGDRLKLSYWFHNQWGS